MQWPQTQLVQAIIILAHYHALSGFILSCGVLRDTYLRKSSESIVSVPGSSDISGYSPTSTSKLSGGSHESSVFESSQSFTSTRVTSTSVTSDMEVDSFPSEANEGALLTRQTSVKQFASSTSGMNVEGSVELSTATTTFYGAQSNNDSHFDTFNTCSSDNTGGNNSNSSLLVVQSEEASPSTNSGGVTPISGRATPSHFFVSELFVLTELSNGSSEILKLVSSKTYFFLSWLFLQKLIDNYCDFCFFLHCNMTHIEIQNFKCSFVLAWGLLVETAERMFICKKKLRSEIFS